MAIVYDWSLIPDFVSREFDSPDEPGSGRKMQDSTIEMLQQARDIYGERMIITSGYRTKKHNRDVGGVEDSAHTMGYAVDISCRSSKQRFRLVRSLIAAGFNRIGIAKTFIHADNDPSKAEDVIWTY